MSFSVKHPLLGKFFAQLINNNAGRTLSITLHTPSPFLVPVPAFTYLFLDYITYLFILNIIVIL